MEDSKGVSYFFLGLGIGVAVGMIFAPQSGAETRGLLQSKAHEGGDYLKQGAETLKHRAEDVRHSATDLVERGKTVVSRQKDQLSAAVEAGKQAYRETVASASESLRSPGAENL